MASLIVYHKSSMEYSFNCHILFFNQVKLYMLAVHNILCGTYTPWAMACHVVCCQSCDEKPQHALGSPHTHCRLLQVLVLIAVQENPDTIFPFCLRLRDLCDLCLTSSPDPGNKHCTLWAQSLAPYRRGIPVVFVFCVWLIALNIVSSQFISCFHKFRISFRTLQQSPVYLYASLYFLSQGLMQP